MIRPVKMINKEPSIIEEYWLPIESIVVQVTSIVINYDIWSFEKKPLRLNCYQWQYYGVYLF